MAWWSPVAGAAKATLKWIAKFLMKWVIVQLLLWMAGAGLAWMILVLEEDIAAAFRKYNEKIMARVYKFEDFIFNMNHQVQEYLDSLLAGIETKALGAVDKVMPEQVDTILKAIGLAVWIDAFLSEIADSAGNAVKDTVATVTEPLVNMIASVRWKIEAVLATLQAVADAIDAAEKAANDKIRAFYDGLVNSIREQENAFNAKVDGLFSQIEGMEDRVNAEVGAVYDGITGAIRKQEDAFNAKVDGLFSDVQGMIDVFNEAVLEIKAKTEAGLPIDWDLYIWTLSDVGINRADYLLSLDIPALTWTFSTGLNRADYLLSLDIPALDFEVTIDVPQLTDAINDVNIAIEEICIVEQSLEMMPQDIRAAFMAHYPDFLRTNFGERMKQFFIIAITAALVQQMEKIRTAFAEARANLEAYFVERKQNIIKETEAIADTIHEAEMAFIRALPDILEPALKKQIDRIKEKVMESQDEILANIDDLNIDLAEVDHVVQRVKKRPAGDNPAKFDSAPWTLDDIYRILCNYYYKYERMALAMIIATQDMGLDTEDMRELLLSAGAPDTGEYDEYPV